MSTDLSSSSSSSSFLDQGVCVNGGEGPPESEALPPSPPDTKVFPSKPFEDNSNDFVLSSRTTDESLSVTPALLQAGDPTPSFFPQVSLLPDPSTDAGLLNALLGSLVADPSDLSLLESLCQLAAGKLSGDPLMMASHVANLSSTSNNLAGGRCVLDSAAAPFLPLPQIPNYPLRTPMVRSQQTSATTPSSMCPPMPFVASRAGPPSPLPIASRFEGMQWPSEQQGMQIRQNDPLDFGQPRYSPQPRSTFVDGDLLVPCNNLFSDRMLRPDHFSLQTMQTQERFKLARERELLSSRASSSADLPQSSSRDLRSPLSTTRISQRPSRDTRTTSTTTSQGPSSKTAGNPLTLASTTSLLSSAPEWQAQFYKTKLCPHYVADIAPGSRQWAEQNVGNSSGFCASHPTCRFAHSFAELRPLPDLRKTKLCASYTKRQPCLSGGCPFAHSPEELRTSSSVFFKVTLCNFYRSGKCWNGPNCRFAHGNQDLRGCEPFNDECHYMMLGERSQGKTLVEEAAFMSQNRMSSSNSSANQFYFPGRQTTTRNGKQQRPMDSGQLGNVNSETTKIGNLLMMEPGSRDGSTSKSSKDLLSRATRLSDDSTIPAPPSQSVSAAPAEEWPTCSRSAGNGDTKEGQATAVGPIKDLKTTKSVWRQTGEPEKPLGKTGAVKSVWRAKETASKLLWQKSEKSSAETPAGPETTPANRETPEVVTKIPLKPVNETNNDDAFERVDDFCEGQTAALGSESETATTTTTTAVGVPIPALPSNSGLGEVGCGESPSIPTAGFEESAVDLLGLLQGALGSSGCFSEFNIPGPVAGIPADETNLERRLFGLIHEMSKSGSGSSSVEPPQQQPAIGWNEPRPSSWIGVTPPSVVELLVHNGVQVPRLLPSAAGTTTVGSSGSLSLCPSTSENTRTPTPAVPSSEGGGLGYNNGSGNGDGSGLQILGFKECGGGDHLTAWQDTRDESDGFEILRQIRNGNYVASENRTDDLLDFLFASAFEGTK